MGPPGSLGDRGPRGGEVGMRFASARHPGREQRLLEQGHWLGTQVRFAVGGRFFPSLLIGLLLAVAARPAQAINGSGSGSSIFNGVFVNDLVGATTFYDWGFGGSRAIVANIEAGSIWNGHESLSGRVSRYLADPLTQSSGGTSLGEADWHATFVGQAIGGSGSYQHQLGIAPTAQLWSGAIATGWSGSGFSGSFAVTETSFLYPYLTAMRTGVTSGSATLRANVINSSWGFDDSAGALAETIAIDALVRENNVVAVFSAGNSGPTQNSVGGLASGYNGISVAAMTGDTLSPPFNEVADFSSRGPGDFYNPATGTTLANARATVDIAAPGDNLTLAFYGGNTGGNRTGSDPTGGMQSAYHGQYYVPDMAGTSFAAPIVAGGAALLVDAGSYFVSASAAPAEMLDARVIKATMMAGANATNGWNNGQVMVDGVITTEQALDNAVGAGMLDLDTAYRIYVGDPAGILFNGTPIAVSAGLNTTLGVSGGGGADGIQDRGWDLGSVQNATGLTGGGANAYSFASPLAAGDLLSVALTWFADRLFTDTLDSARDIGLSDLSLELWRTDVPAGDSLIARSISPYGTSEFLRLQIPEAGDYDLRVVGLDRVYDLGSSGELPADTTYGLAWSVTAVPEPSSLLLCSLAAAICGIHATRRRGCPAVTSGPRQPGRPCRRLAAARR